jgi:RNA polymerase-interacting CarD/CdnL/TRCF family regulator
MPKRTFRIRQGEPLLDIVSYGRGGLRETGDRLAPAQLELIQRTVRRTPEAVVKVLPRASNDFKAVGKHLDYIGRKGELDLETDDGERLSGRIGKDLLEDWDLDIDDVRRQATLAATKGRKPPKLVHKLMFSMPPGTSPDGVLGAVRNFAREEFWGQHRYAFVLHTDEAHPHVHLVLKAVNEEGVRLNIKKATLRHWRSEFARNLRLLGVEANATERAVRGESTKAKKDGIYRATLRGESTHMRERAEAVAVELAKRKLRIEPGKASLVETRNEVRRAWLVVRDILIREQQPELAAHVRRFAEQMTPPLTEKEWIAEQLSDRLAERTLQRDLPVR